MENETNAFEDLLSKTTDYLETRVEIIKLKAVGKASDMASAYVSRLVIGFVFSLVIVFLNIALALWLGSILGEAYLGFFAITGFYLLVLAVLYLGRKQLLKAPAKNSIIKHFLN